MTRCPPCWRGATLALVWAPVVLGVGTGFALALGVRVIDRALWGAR